MLEIAASVLIYRNYSLLFFKQATQDYNNNVYNIYITWSAVSGIGMIYGVMVDIPLPQHFRQWKWASMDFAVCVGPCSSLQ